MHKWCTGHLQVGCQRSRCWFSLLRNAVVPTCSLKTSSRRICWRKQTSLLTPVTPASSLHVPTLNSSVCTVSTCTNYEQQCMYCMYVYQLWTAVYVFMYMYQLWTAVYVLYVRVPTLNSSVRIVCTCTNYEQQCTYCIYMYQLWTAVYVLSTCTNHEQQCTYCIYVYQLNSSVRIVCTCTNWTAVYVLCLRVPIEQRCTYCMYVYQLNSSVRIVSTCTDYEQQCTYCIYVYQLWTAVYVLCLNQVVFSWTCSQVMFLSDVFCAYHTITQTRGLLLLPSSVSAYFSGVTLA